MARVICSKVRPGLRDTERVVAVKDVEGRAHHLRVDADYLTEDAGRVYLPIGIVSRSTDGRYYLIELRLEADSGANRIWVAAPEVMAEFKTPA